MNINSLFSKIYPFLQKIISNEGFTVKSYIRVSIPPSIRIDTSFFNGGIKISFPDEKPVAKGPVLAKLKILAIHLNNDGGVIEIDNFPDSSFTFKEIEEMLLDLGV